MGRVNIVSACLVKEGRTVDSVSFLRKGKSRDLDLTNVTQSERVTFDRHCRREWRQGLWESPLVRLTIVFRLLFVGPNGSLLTKLTLSESVTGESRTESLYEYYFTSAFLRLKSLWSRGFDHLYRYVGGLISNSPFQIPVYQVFCFWKSPRTPLPGHEKSIVGWGTQNTPFIYVCGLRYSTHTRP